MPIGFGSFDMKLNLPCFQPNKLLLHLGTSNGMSASIGEPMFQPSSALSARVFYNRRDSITEQDYLDPTNYRIVTE